MARKTLDFPIEAEGRDKGKVFRLREMPATRAEKWAIRAFLMLARSGVEVPNELQDAGLVGLAVMGIEALSKANYAEAEPLLDEMFEFITIMPRPTDETSERKLIEEDIEEVMTRLTLRKALWGLHTDFIPGVAALKTSAQAASAMAASTSSTQTAPG